jgi:WD40 repeat protein
MTSATEPLPAGAPSRPRVFGARPFHTDGDLLALGFAPDGSLWSVEEPGVLRHWDVAGRRQVGFHPLDELATLWAFSGDTRLVAAGSDELSVWETATGKVRASWPQPSWVTAIAFPPAGDLLATGHDDAVVRLWCMASDRMVQEFRGHAMAVSALAFSPDGARLATAGEDRVIRLWDVASGRQVGSLIGHTDRIPALAWRPDGRRIVSAGWDTTARVWDVATCEPIILLNSHAGQVHTLAFSPDGSRLACADSDDAVHVWDAEHHRTLTVLRDQATAGRPAAGAASRAGQAGATRLAAPAAEEPKVRCLAFSPDGQRLASGGGERVIHLWDARQGPDSEQGTDPHLSRTCVAVSPDGRRLASLGMGTALRVWDTASGQSVLELEGAPVLRAFAASPDGRWFAGSVAADGGVNLPPGARNTVRLWQADSGRRQAALEGPAAPVTSLVFSPDSTLLASAGSQTSDVWLWRVPSGEPVLLIPGAAEGCSVQALAFHPNGRLLAAGGIDPLAAGGADGVVAIWDIQERRMVKSRRGGAQAVAFSPDGKRLAVASPGQAARVWDVEDGQAADLIGHLDAVTCLAFSPDGLLLATGSDDRTVRLWDAGSGLPRGVAELDTQVKAVAFAPDGRHLFTGNGNTSCCQLDLALVLSPSQ